MATLAEARLRACKMWPYGSHDVLSLVPVERRGFGTLAVDEHWRLYYDPQALADKPLDKSAGTILHEVCHLSLKHHRRAKHVLPTHATAADWERWNRATDYAINSLLREQGVPLWDGMLFPEQVGLAPCLSSEEYFRLLTPPPQDTQEDSGDDNGGNEQQGDDNESGTGGDNGGDDDAPSQAGGEADGTAGSPGKAGDSSAAGGDTAPDAGNSGGGIGGVQSDSGGGPDKCPADPGTTGGGGSCADGIQRPWELPAPSDCDVPGIKPYEADILARETAKRILEKGRGEGSSAWQRWAENVLNPRVDPRLALLRFIRAAVEVTSGQGDYSYRRPNRRNPSRDMLRPSCVQPIPRITVIVDTSGSMDQRDLGLSLGLIGKVLNGFRIRDGIKVVTGDTRAVTQARVFDPRQITLAGGGGTDMGVLIRQVAEQKPAPQLIVVCTDGDTPWCEPQRIPVVACVTNEHYAKSVPSWIKTVALTT